MEALFVHGIDREIWTAEQAWIVECAYLDDDGRESWRTRYDMGAAFGAELASYRPLEIAADELFGRSLSIGESCYRHRNENVGRTTRDVLAFPAMALGFHHGFAFSDIAQRAAIATTFELHKILVLEPGILVGIFSFQSGVRFAPGRFSLQTRISSPVGEAVIPKPLKWWTTAA
jgi:hypothetical protein